MDSQRGHYHYQAFGLQIQSALLLPGLVLANGESKDIDVRFAKVSHHRQPVAVDVQRFFWAQKGQACHILTGVGAFLVNEGREILVDAETIAPEELLRVSLLGPGLALALSQRGFFVLHASAVAIDGSAVGFMGGVAHGKSTMAAALHGLGHAFVSDDVTAVRLDGPDPQVEPSYPLLKLWPDAARSLGVSFDRLPKVHPSFEKRVLRVDRDFDTLPLRLRRLYVLVVGDKVSIEPLSPTQGFEELMMHWYCARFGPEYLQAIDFEALFLHAGQLGRQVSVRRLTRPATLSDDPGLSKAIEAEILQDLDYDKKAVSMRGEAPPIRSDRT